MMNDFLRVEHLTKTFSDVKALDDVSFMVSEGEMFGLLGPDGAGKSTCMKILSGLLSPTSGEAWVNGYSTATDLDRVKGISRHMSQGFDLYPDLSVQENLSFFADLLGVKGDLKATRIEQLLAFTHLAPFRHRPAGKLSGGMKQKLELAVALVYTPKVLLLDEPTNGVDPVSRRDFWNVLYQLQQQGVTLIITTTYLDEAERCSRLGLMHEGRLLAMGTPKELKNSFVGAIISIHCNRPRLASKLLQGVFPAWSVNLYGRRLHVVTATPERTQMTVAEILSKEDVVIDKMEQVSPSLEDVFSNLLTVSEKAVDSL